MNGALLDIVEMQEDDHPAIIIYLNSYAFIKVYRSVLNVPLL